eukprot:930091_1
MARLIVLLACTILCIVHAEWTEIWFDACDSQGDWTCVLGNNCDINCGCEFARLETKSDDSQCAATGMTGTCHRLKKDSWIERSTDISQYAANSLRLNFYVAGQGLNSLDNCAAYTSYNGGNDWDEIWKSGSNNPQWVTADIPSSEGESNIIVALEVQAGTSEYCHFDQVTLSYLEPTPSPTPDPTNETPAPTPSPTPSPTDPTRGPTSAPTPAPTPSPTPSPTPNPTPKPTTNEPTPGPTTLNPTRSPTSNPTKKPTPNPTKKPTLNPTKRPTANPTKKPTSSPTKNPTRKPTKSPSPAPTDYPTFNPTPRPTHPAISTCGDIVSGEFHGEMVEFLVTMPFKGDLTFDAGASTFVVTNIEAFTKLGIPQGEDVDGDETIELVNVPQGNYKFKLYGEGTSSGTFSAQIRCGSRGPTPNPVQGSTPTPKPTIKPTLKPTTPNPTARPTANPSHPASAPTTTTTTTTTKAPTGNPSRKPTTASPTQPGALPCGVATVGVYYGGGDLLIFESTILFQGRITFDASASNFAVTSVQVQTKLGTTIGTDNDGDGILTVDLPAGDYTFVMVGGSNGIYHVKMECVASKEPTRSPAKGPTLHPSEHPTVRPSSGPTNQPSDVPTSSPTQPPTPADTLVCGDTDTGSYDGATLTFNVYIPYSGTLTFDASNSNFNIQTMEATSHGSDDDHDAVITLEGVSSAMYEFVINAGTAEANDVYDVRVTCSSESPTQDPSTAPIATTSASPTTTTTITVAPTPSLEITDSKSTSEESGDDDDDDDDDDQGSDSDPSTS